ncbi:hypothetical protein SALBM135S_08747 [Streptomyces alboniger]
MEAVHVGGHQLGVAAGRAVRGDDGAAEPGRVDAGADRVDDTRGLTAEYGGSSGSGGALSEASPVRITVSTKCAPAARTAIRTWPGPATGSGQVSWRRFSAGPNSCRTTACTASSSDGFDTHHPATSTELEVKRPPAGNARA